MIRNLGKCKLFGEHSWLNISIYFHYFRTLHQKEWKDIEGLCLQGQRKQRLKGEESIPDEKGQHVDRIVENEN